MKAPELKPGQCDSYTSDALKRMDEAVKLSYETVERETCREAERNGRTTATVADVEIALNRIVVSVTGWYDEPPRNDEFPWIKVEPQSGKLVWRKEPPDREGIWACGYNNRVTDVNIYSPSHVYCYSHYCYLGDVPTFEWPATQPAPLQLRPCDGCDKKPATKPS